MFSIPKTLRTRVGNSPEGAMWLSRLPALIAAAVARWSLTIDEPVGRNATSSWVAPSVTRDGERAYLKIGFPHMEARDEIAGLAHWDGHGAVRLLDAAPEDHAMLLEACRPGVPLRSRSWPEQDTTVASVLHVLWRANADAPLRPLSEMTRYWCDCALARVERWHDPGLIRAGLAELRTLPNDDAATVVLHTDLHAGNILSAERSPWLAIDPKPFVGDPAYDATQHLLNGRTRLAVAPTRTIARFAEQLEVDAERVRRWLFARLAQEASLDPAAGELARLVERAIV